MSQPHLDLGDLVRRSQALARGAGLAGPPAGDGALREVGEFGPNPGQLRMLTFVPPGLPAGAPLVLVLHGCGQTAGGYDRGSGWSALATRLGFALVFPEQRPANNPNRCFNWFRPADTRRDAGEAASIRQMVAWMLPRHRLDPRRVFVTGLSAGGAMASVMLAAYPDSVAAGAIIAGLPYGAAQSIPEAFEAMATGRPRPAEAWAEAVRRASPHRGPWPRVSIWQGSADATVRPVNADQILAQWRALHGPAATAEAERLLAPGHRLALWRGPDGRVLIELHRIEGMGHGVPIAPRAGTPPLGEAGPFMLDVGIASTAAIAEFFGLGAAHAGEAAPARPLPNSSSGPSSGPSSSPSSGPAPGLMDRIDPRPLLRRALRAAGLLDR